jgi:hypothetical protein
VPSVRGEEISRPFDDIVAEVQGLAAQGVTEISLLGQNVNSYGQDLVESGRLPQTETGPFVDLLVKVLAEVPDLNRLRFTTSNPHDFTKPLAELFHNDPKMGAYIHLPVQSGSDRIYFRIYEGSKTYIATYNLNQKETKTFIHFSKHFKAAGLPVPEVLAVNSDDTIYIQEDLGTESLLNQIEKEGHSQHELSASSLRQFHHQQSQLSRFCFPPTHVLVSGEPFQLLATLAC